MSTNLDQGGLKLVNIQNKITLQRIVWLLKPCSMEQACFTGVGAEEQIGHFEVGYHSLDFLKTNPDCFPIHSNDKFYEEVIKATVSQPSKCLKFMTFRKGCFVIHVEYKYLSEAVETFITISCAKDEIR